MDGPHQGLKIYTKSTRLMDPIKGQTPRSTKWTDPTKAKLIQIQKVNGPNKDQTYVKKKGMDPTNVQNLNKHNGRTQPAHKIIQVHNVDNHQGSRPHSTKWTEPTRVAKIMKVHDVDGLN